MITRRSLLKSLAVTPGVFWLAYKAVDLFGGSGEGKAPSAGNPPNKETIRIYSAQKRGYIVAQRVYKTEDEWKKILTPEQFRILRQKGTEFAFHGQYWNNHEKGVYQCAACRTDLFSSDTKFESGTGWPSFWTPIAPENVSTQSDQSWMMERNEVHCARCEGHLGHVFDDGPQPTGLRYCINSAALVFVKTG